MMENAKFFTNYRQPKRAVTSFFGEFSHCWFVQASRHFDSEEMNRKDFFFN